MYIYIHIRIYIDIYIYIYIYIYMYIYKEREIHIYKGIYIARVPLVFSGRCAELLKLPRHHHLLGSLGFGVWGVGFVWDWGLGFGVWT